jgi:N-acetylglucosaminyldiphosphoundecaprenol N-acetyl-beta-D-mannosaminyltransferase
MKQPFISLDISRISFSKALDECIGLARIRKSSYACFSNVHMVVEGWDSEEVRNAVNGADFAFADGMPVAKGISVLHGETRERIAGMDFIEPFLQRMDKENLRLTIFGGGAKTHKEALKQIPFRFPGIAHLQCISPPHRIWTLEEVKSFVSQINSSEPNAVFVILGCPKQEKFMANVSKEIPALMLGLGGALPTFLGIHKRAPEWMRMLMLEWLYRLIQEPGRLWKRYTYTNIKFIFLFARFWLTGNKTRKE